MASSRASQPLLIGSCAGMRAGLPLVSTRRLVRRIGAALLLAVFLSVTACQPNAGTTRTAITVTYAFDQAIAGTANLKKQSAPPTGVEPLARVSSTLAGNSTHASHMDGELFDLDAGVPAPGGKKGGKKVDGDGKTRLFVFKSPGHAGTETLTLVGAQAMGKKLVVNYVLDSPEVNTADFQQVTSSIQITFE